MTDGVVGWIPQRTLSNTMSHIYCNNFPDPFPRALMGIRLRAQALETEECHTFPGLFYHGSSLTLVPGDLDYCHVPVTMWGLHGSNNQ